MNILFYIPVAISASEGIHEVVDIAALKAGIEVFRNIEDLSRRLSQPAEGPAIAVLIAGNKEDLINITCISRLLSDLPLILILPDREKNTTAMGYTLNPRFLTYADSNFAEVGAVLEKMLEVYKKKEMASNGKIHGRATYQPA